MPLYKCDGQCIFIICQFRYQLFYVLMFLFVESMDVATDYWVYVGLPQEAGVGLITAIMWFNYCSCTLCITPHKKILWKNIMVIRSCAFLCRSPVPILGIDVWGVGLRWDDDAGKSRIMRLGCDCRCLRRMKGLSWGWGWAGCIRDSMEWWGISWHSGTVVWWVVRYFASGGVWW